MLGAGIVLLGATLVTGQVFKAERPETMGYPIEGVEEESSGAAAEPPIAHFLQTADAARGESAFRKCAACHTINQGGANGLGPNLYANMGAAIAHVAGFNYSDALRSHGGNWDWDAMSAWLASPRSFAPGTRMTFAGLSNPQERADLLLYLNQQGGNLQLPPPPAVEEPAAEEADGEGNEAATAEGDEAAPAEANEAAPAAAE